jgi:hypothetical protein
MHGIMSPRNRHLLTYSSLSRRHDLARSALTPLAYSFITIGPSVDVYVHLGVYVPRRRLSVDSGTTLAR